MPTIVIAEDEMPIRRVLTLYFERAGYDVLQAENGEEALRFWKEHAVDGFVLDIMMPFVDGWTVLETIRAESDVPIIMLTALGDVPNRIQGLKKGADDYIAKPFEAEEVVLRMEAIFKRIVPPRFVYGSLVIVPEGHIVTLNGRTIDLTPKDFAMLAFLARHPNRTFTREEIIEHVWGNFYEGSDRAIDVAVKRIRQALRDWPAEEGQIKTIRGTGYQFHVPA